MFGMLAKSASVGFWHKFLKEVINRCSSNSGILFHNGKLQFALAMAQVGSGLLKEESHDFLRNIFKRECFFCAALNSYIVLNDIGLNVTVYELNVYYMLGGRDQILHGNWCSVIDRGDILSICWHAEQSTSLQGHKRGGCTKLYQIYFLSRCDKYYLLVSSAMVRAHMRQS